MDLGLRDHVIVVTGGGAGIGEAVSRSCLDEGAKVVVVSRASENVKNFLGTMQREQRPPIYPIGGGTRNEDYFRCGDCKQQITVAV